METMDILIRGYVERRNDEIMRDLFNAAVAHEKGDFSLEAESIKKIMNGVVANSDLVLQVVPQPLAPFYSLVLSAAIPGLTPSDEDKRVLESIKELVGVSCMTVVVPHDSDKEDEEDGES